MKKLFYYLCIICALSISTKSYSKDSLKSLYKNSRVGVMTFTIDNGETAKYEIAKMGCLGLCLGSNFFAINTNKNNHTQLGKFTPFIFEEAEQCEENCLILRHYNKTDRNEYIQAMVLKEGAISVSLFYNNKLQDTVGYLINIFEPKFKDRFEQFYNSFFNLSNSSKSTLDELSQNEKQILTILLGAIEYRTKIISPYYTK